MAAIGIPRATALPVSVQALAELVRGKLEGRARTAPSGSGLAESRVEETLGRGH